MRHLTKILTFSMSLVAFSSYGEEKVSDSIDKSARKADVEVKKQVFDVVDKDSVTVDFKEGSATLADSEKRTLKALVQSLDRSVGNTKVAIGAWSDHDYPVSGKLTDAEERLATDRARAVQQYVESLAGFKGITVYNMAKNDSRFAKFFGTKDSKVKDAYVGARNESPEVDFVGKRLQDKGSKSKVVVVFYDAKTIVNG